MVFKILTDGAEGIIHESSSFEEAQSKLQSLVSKNFIDEFAKQMQKALSTTDALGRSIIVEKDKIFSDQQKVVSAKFKVGKFKVRADGMVWIEAADKPVRISFDLIPREALLEFTRRGFWIGGIENQKFIDEVKAAFGQAIADGQTYEEFAANFKDLFLKYGITPENTIRLDTIFRTNLFAAYTAGQVNQMEQVRDRFPVWRWSQIQDTRRNPDHVVLNGKYFRSGPYPPIWYNDRCSAIFIHSSQLTRLGDIQIHNSVYDFLSTEKVIDFAGTGSFEKWVSENPVSNDVQSIINSGLS